MTKVAVLSDSHDHLPALARALTEANEAGAEVLIHCGDLSAPFVLRMLAEHFGGPIHVVFGNNDADGRLLQSIAAQHSRITLHGIFAQSGQLDLVCYGHDHTQLLEQIGSSWLLNPGELMGLRSTPSWALYDTEAHHVTVYLLD
jgi:predicted phosphodiesterase